MDDLAHELERTRDAVRVDWSAERQAASRDGVARRIRRRARVRVASAAGAVAAVAVAAIVLVQKRPWSHPNEPSNAVAHRARRVPFADGSSATIFEEGALATVDSSPQRTVLRVDRGHAEFDVVHDPARVFRVEVGDVAVQVLGTRFVVDRTEHGAHVGVIDGRVRVFWADRYADLSRGEDRTFTADTAGSPVSAIAAASTAEDDSMMPTPPSAVADAGVTNTASTDDAGSASRVAPAVTTVARWRALAERGDFDAAFDALAHGGSSGVHDNVSELLAAADVARMSGHANEAAGYLHRILDHHGNDARAPLSAFTLGRVLLDDLGRPRDAAEAFANARRLGPHNDLAEDALAREVEAWSRSGDAARARGAAEEYLRAYPSGQRLRSVRRFGGLE